MNGKEKSQPIEPIRKTPGENSLFLPDEVVDRVDDLFLVREFDGPIVEKRLSIRRPLFERALRYAILRRLDPKGPRPMQRSAGSAANLSVVARRTA